MSLCRTGLIIDRRVWAAVRENFSGTQKRSGIQGKRSKTGLERIRQALDSDPAFIIAGVDLPDIDGLEVIRRILAAKTRVPIVAITSLALAGDRESILAAGCNACFEKPIDPLTIDDRIHRAIGVA